MSSNTKGAITKQKILVTAAALFAEKGYTETTIRELTEAIGLKNPASLYHHFPSKNAILEQMLDDYSEGNISLYEENTIRRILRESPNIDGILACMQTAFPPEHAEYYFSVLCVILQEQLRNPIAKEYMCINIVKRAEYKVSIIISVLKELGVIRPDTDADYWMKVTSCLSQSFATRMMLGIGDSSADFEGMGMAELLRHTYTLMLETCSI
ncbi:MAG: TetR/AcrR family transcriptional regulator [Oscillospiraceae bacterium]|nr:TetR/AcrR family transcriptional regulator [Oscillospiraceae bacterium]